MAQSLQTLLEGLYASILEARRFVNAQHLKLFESYFETTHIVDPQTGKTIEAYRPQRIAVAIDKPGNPSAATTLVDVPVLALIKLSHLSIDTIDIEFEAKLTNLDSLADDRPPPAPAAPAGQQGVLRRTIADLFGTSADISIMPKGAGFQSSASPAKVRITFKATEAAEGVHLIQEHMLDYIRQ